MATAASYDKSVVVEVEEYAGLPPDEELVERLRRKDENAFALLVDAWSGAILRLARTFVSTDESAAEIVQETWLSVIKSISTFEGRSSLKTWVYRVLVHAAKRRCAQEGRTIPLSNLPTREDYGPSVDPSRFRDPSESDPGDWRIFPRPWPQPTPEQATLNKEIRQELEAALEMLPGRQRIVIILRDIEGRSSDEVCEILDISPANQRVLLHRARSFVRSRLEFYFSST